MGSVCGGLRVTLSSYSHFPKTFPAVVPAATSSAPAAAGFPPSCSFYFCFCTNYVKCGVFFFFSGKKINKDHGQWLLVMFCVWLLVFFSPGVEETREPHSTSPKVSQPCHRKPERFGWKGH